MPTELEDDLAEEPAKKAETTVMRILMVEDCDADARLIREIVGQAKSTAIERAHCLETALERVGAETFDALLLDLSLPDVTGIDTLRRISAAVPDTPIIVLTASDDEDVASQAVACGAQDYLVKDSSIKDELMRCLRRAVQRKSAQRSHEELRHFQKAVLDALASHVAVIDEHGRILAVNAAWRRFAETNSLSISDAGIGANYLDV